MLPHEDFLATEGPPALRFNNAPLHYSFPAQRLIPTGLLDLVVYFYPMGMLCHLVLLDCEIFSFGF